MDHNDIIQAVYNPSLRPKLLAELIGDPILLAHARRHYAKMQGMHQIGQVFDRDHTSRAMHEMLTRMFAQVDAAKALESGVTIE